MPQQSKQDCQSLVRVLNRMLRAAKSRQELELPARNDPANDDRSKSRTLTKQRSRSRDRGENQQSHGTGRIRIQNILTEIDNAAVLSVFKNVSMKIVAEGQTNAVTKEVICELHNPQDMPKCLGMSGTMVGGLQI